MLVHMKKNGMLHAELLRVIGQMGHTDSLVIGDVGLPIPLHVPRIDLALTEGTPGFLHTLQVVLGELCVERSVIAAETIAHNSKIYRALSADAGATIEGIAHFMPPPHLETVPSHEEFKKLCACARAIVRTGEATPYANIILFSGVTF